MSNNEEEIIDDESDVRELSDNKEEIEHDSASETNLDSDFDEEDDKFQAPLVVLQQPLIPSQRQPPLHSCLFYSGCDQRRLNIRPAALPAIVPNVVPQGVGAPKGQNTKIELWELFFDNAILESIANFTNIIKMGLLRFLFQCDRDTKETDVVKICVLFNFLYMAGLMCASRMSIDD